VCEGALAPGDADDVHVVLTVEAAPAGGDAGGTVGGEGELLIDAFFFEPA